MNLPWYVWVWGTISTLAGLLCVVLIILGIDEVRKGRKGEGWRIADLKSENRALRRKGDEYIAEIKVLRAQLIELRKERNEFGRISP